MSTYFAKTCNHFFVCFCIKKRRIGNTQNMSKTITQIIKQTFLILTQKWSIFMSAGALQLLFCLALVLVFPPFGFVLAWATFAITSVHLAGHNLKRLQNQKTNLQNIFTTKNYFSILATKVVRFIQVAFWSIFLIVPGIWTALDYSMVDHLLALDPSQDSFDVLTQSIALTKDNKAKLFAFWLLYALLATLVFVFSASVVVIFRWFVPLPVQQSVIILSCIFGLLFLVVVLPFVHVSQALIFEDLVVTKTQQFQNPENAQTQTTQQTKKQKTTKTTTKTAKDTTKTTKKVSKTKKASH
jgi:hypothetical protein